MVRTTTIMVLIIIMLVLCNSLYADNDAVLYSPDIVGVDRIFLIALDVPTGAEALEVTVPGSVEMFDRTPLPADSTLRKYYFRSKQPAETAEIVFAHPGGDITIPLEIWSYEDLREFRELKGNQLPRRWPLGEELPELKQEQTITPDVLKENLKGRPPSAKQYLDMDDETIWNMQPDSTIPRWHWTNVQAGCPVHGTEIYKGRAFYPWQNEKGNTLRSYTANVPYQWKIKCPVGGELYPSNDFASGDMTGGEFPDDGIGGGCEYEGTRYGFIAEICQSYCHQMLRVAPACADSYVRTGDIAYVHKALVAMCRVAAEYAYLATMTHHRHRNSRNQVTRLGQSRFSDGPFLSGAGFTVYCIDQPGYQRQYAEAYDRIFPAIDKDPYIIPFLQSKGFDVQTHEDVRRFIEENLMAVWMQGAMDLATHSNEPYHQWGLARMAEMLNYKRGDEFMDWLYDGKGHMRIFMPNDFFRDGAPYESTGGYNGMHVTALGPIVESIEHLREMRPELYPDEKYPNFSESRRYHNVFDFSMNTVNIDRTYPRVGDGGAWPQYQKLSMRTWQNGGAQAFEHAYGIFEDPKFAWALANAPGWSPSLEFPYSREEIEKAAEKWPDDWNDGSRIEDGYGLAMLRSGDDLNKRAFWMEYGQPRGHTHEDMLHIGMDAFQSEILGHMGYPRNWNRWYKNWITQLIARQFPWQTMQATSQLFVDAGPVHVTEALARPFADHVSDGEGYEVREDMWQRRMLAIVDVSDDQFYCLDLHRIFGGTEHWWTFHCQEGELETTGADFEKQDGGTVAGPDVEYGDEEWLAANGCSKGRYGWSGERMGFAYMYNVQRARPTEPWSADWTLKNSDGLHFRLTSANPDGAEAIIADATSPAGGDPYEMKFLLLSRKGDEPQQTQIANVMDMYRGEPFIKSIEPVELSGEDEDAFEPYGIRVDLGTRTDTIFASSDAAQTRTARDGFEFAGRFGLYSEENGHPTQMVLIGGTRLVKNGIGITQETGEFRSEIVNVDYDNETITISPAPENPESLTGQYIYITNSARRLCYRVREVHSDGESVRLKLYFDPMIGTGRVTGTDDHRVQTNTPFRLRGYRYYDGARVVNADHSAEYRISGINGFALIDDEEHPEAPKETLEAQFPEDTWFKVYDYGIGDRIVWPKAVSVSRISDNTYRVIAFGDVTITLPEDTGARIVQQ